MQETIHSKLVTAFERMASGIDPIIAAILDRAAEGKEISADEGTELFKAKGRDLNALVLVADELRRQAVGDVVTYVVNRNINFTNVCIKRCGFCAFSRDFREEEGYFLPIPEIVRRAKEAWDLGATEVCIQAGLPPKMDGQLYVKICRAIKKELPDLHIHGFSPEEVLYGAARSGVSIEDYLKMLKEAGVGSLPGTAAEILDDEVREAISPGRISTRTWLEVIKTAHKLGIPTTSTIMYGHVETDEHKARHLAVLRDIQKETKGFTEFVPLSFVHTEAPMYKRGMLKGVRAGATGMEIVKMHVVSRLMLNGHINNIQVSWVKEGMKLAQLCLDSGANDLGGTLMNESISTAAGAPYGQFVRPIDFRRLIRDISRIPAERSTLYKIRKVFDQEDGNDSPLDMLDSAERFGSYHELTKRQDFRFKDEAKAVPEIMA